MAADMAKLTPQQTAAWLAGEQVDWMANAVDPKVQEEYARFQLRMRLATAACVSTFYENLMVDSEATAKRLQALFKAAATDGDARSAELVIVLVAQLMRTGLGLGAL
jgi:hypothetical protein